MLRLLLVPLLRIFGCVCEDYRRSIDSTFIQIFVMNSMRITPCTQLCTIIYVHETKTMNCVSDTVFVSSLSR